MIALLERMLCVNIFNWIIKFIISQFGVDLISSAARRFKQIARRGAQANYFLNFNCAPLVIDQKTKLKQLVTNLLQKKEEKKL